ncbi:MAG: hypothetical protein EA340_09660 [Nitriliruptor sp.]|nr:MAG: hypothetical protein EA340_09660 [Nitriliruptor sp.]
MTPPVSSTVDAGSVVLLDRATHLLLAVTGGDRPSWLPWLMVGLFGVVMAISWTIQRHQRRELHEALNRFVDRHDGWHLQAWPCGVHTEQLVGRFEATPRGDRRYGVESAVGGPAEMEISGATVPCQVACFVWFHERRRTQRSRGRRARTTYDRRTELVAMCQLPVHTHRAVSIRPESTLGRVGLTRSGQQLESEAFNRRFRVEGRDRALVVTLLDAGLQELLAAEYGERGIELSDDLLVLSGEPTHRDRSLAGIAQTYPAILQDLTRLVRSIPPPFWRSLAFERPTPDTSPPPPPSPPSPQDR